MSKYAFLRLDVRCQKQNKLLYHLLFNLFQLYMQCCCQMQLIKILNNEILLSDITFGAQVSFRADKKMHRGIKFMIIWHYLTLTPSSSVLPDKVTAPALLWEPHVYSWSDKQLQHLEGIVKAITTLLLWFSVTLCNFKAVTVMKINPNHEQF